MYVNRAAVVRRAVSPHVAQRLRGAAPLRLMTDHKSGVPRTSYQGILTFRYGQTPARDLSCVPAAAAAAAALLLLPPFVRTTRPVAGCHLAILWTTR